MRFLVVLALLAPLAVAGTGFDYPNPTTLRLFNEGSLKPFCINTTSGIALENCGFDWADTTWCVASRRNANPWAQTCTNGTGMTYRVASDNLTYANATFQVPLSGGHVFILNYNLTRYASFIDVQPNFTTGASVPSNTRARFQILQRNININDTLVNNLVYFDNKTYNLSQGGTNNTDNTTDERTLAIYQSDDAQQIFYGWNSSYPTKLTVWPQPGYANRQLNLTFEFGVIAARKSYVVPIKWQDLELACAPGTSVISVATSINSTKANFTSTDRFNITGTAFKLGMGGCTYYLYYKTTSASKFSLIPSTMTGSNIDLPVGQTIGLASQVSTPNASVRWTILLGGMNTSWGNSNNYKNFTFQLNVSGVTDDSGDALGLGYKTVAVWDTRPPNVTILTANNSNFTLGSIFVAGNATDETNLRAVELYTNESGEWRYAEAWNASSNSINKSIAPNFSRSPPTGCYLYAFRALQTTGTAVSNLWNVTANVTLCVDSSAVPVAQPMDVGRLFLFAQDDGEDEGGAFPWWWPLLAVFVLFVVWRGMPSVRQKE